MSVAAFPGALPVRPAEAAGVLIEALGPSGAVDWSRQLTAELEVNGDASTLLEYAQVLLDQGHRRTARVEVAEALRRLRVVT
jgi:hypothetical protein